MVELIDLAPTLYELAGVEAGGPLDGRSLVAVAEGRRAQHRDHVFVEYAPNDEAMVRDSRRKLVYERGRRRRTDGYDTGRPLVARHLRLYDLAADPGEMHNVAGEAANAATVKRLTALLVEHLVKTAREPQNVAESSDPLVLLDECVQPRDVGPPKRD